MRTSPLLALAVAWWFVTWVGSNGAIAPSGPWESASGCELMRATAMQENAYVGRCADGPPPKQKDFSGAQYTYRSSVGAQEDQHRLLYANGTPMWFAGALERAIPVTTFSSDRDDWGP